MAGDLQADAAATPIGDEFPELYSLLRRMRGWLVLLVTLGAIVTAAMALVALREPAAAEAITAFILTFIVYAAPTVLLARCAARVGTFLGSGELGDLQRVLAAHRDFWVYLGALMVIGLVVVLALVIMALLVFG